MADVSSGHGMGANEDSGAKRMVHEVWNVKGDRMAIAELIYEQTKKLPEHLARGVLDFVGYLVERQERERDP